MKIYDSCSGLKAGETPRAPAVETIEEIVLVFPSNTTVLNVEDLLEELELSFKLIPVPKEVNPNCGLAISFSGRERPEITRALNEAGFRPSATYILAGGRFQDAGNERLRGSALF